MPDPAPALAKPCLTVHVLDESPMLAKVPVTVWTIDLAPPDSVLAVAMALLSDEERSAAARFRAASDRAAFVIRRAARRRILGAACDADPAAIEFATNASGRPTALNPGAPRFSASRAGRLGLFATAPLDLGVDVEAAGALAVTQALAARILAPAEQATWASLDSTLHAESLLHAWTRKEAVAKALGHGLAVAPDRLDVWRPGRPTMVCDGDGRAISVRGLPLGSGFVAAVAMVGGHPATTVLAWQWPEASKRKAGR